MSSLQVGERDAAELVALAAADGSAEREGASASSSSSSRSTPNPAVAPAASKGVRVATVDNFHVCNMHWLFFAFPVSHNL